MILIYVVFSIDALTDGGANKGSDSAGHGGESDGMLLFVGCCIILVSFCSHTYLLIDVAFDGAGNGGTDNGSREDGANKGSGGDGRGGASDGMLLCLLCFVLF